MAAFLEVRDLIKRFGATRALDHVSLSVGHDELLVVIGPTGAGKTTLLRTIAGLEAPEAGSILMNGEHVTHRAPAARDVALVFQNFSLYPDRSVRKNIEFPLRAPGRGMSEREIAERVQWAASILKITHLLDRPATRLSGGEMQRVAIGRAIVRRPRLFLMDEPLTNLDAKLRENLRVELLLIRRELKTPMVYVTHDQAEALSMADRIVVLFGGKVLQTGAPQEVYRNPASPAVARQLGQPAINLIPVQRREAKMVSVDGLMISSARDDSPLRAIAGIRPEDISCTGGEREAVVKVVEDLGAVLVLLVEWLGQEVRILASKDVAAVKAGDRIFPRIDATRVVIWPDQR